MLFIVRLHLHMRYAVTGANTNLNLHMRYAVIDSNVTPLTIQAGYSGLLGKVAGRCSFFLPSPAFATVGPIKGFSPVVSSLLLVLWTDLETQKATAEAAQPN